jgi:hypothetical protein
MHATTPLLGFDWKRSKALLVGVEGALHLLRLSPSEQNEQTRSNQTMFVAVKLPVGYGAREDRSGYLRV